MWSSALAARRIQIGGMLRVAAEFHLRHLSDLGGRIRYLQEVEHHSRKPLARALVSAAGRNVVNNDRECAPFVREEAEGT